MGWMLDGIFQSSVNRKECCFILWLKRKHCLLLLLFCGAEERVVQQLFFLFWKGMHCLHSWLKNEQVKKKKRPNIFLWPFLQLVVKFEFLSLTLDFWNHCGLYWLFKRMRGFFLFFMTYTELICCVVLFQISWTAIKDSFIAVTSVHSAKCRTSLQDKWDVH